jgi:xanthine/uracil permease
MVRHKPRSIPERHHARPRPRYDDAHSAWMKQQLINGCCICATHALMLHHGVASTTHESVASHARKLQHSSMDMYATITGVLFASGAVGVIATWCVGWILDLCLPHLVGTTVILLRWWTEQQ